MKWVGDVALCFAITFVSAVALGAAFNFVEGWL